MTIDYVKLYAEKLKEDPSLFKQQKMLIESQMQSSTAFFKKLFADTDFKTSARKYLRDIGMLK